MFSYAFKNLRSLFTRQRLLAFLLILNIIASAFVLCFSYGVYRNYDEIRERGEKQTDVLNLSVRIETDEFVCINEGDIAEATHEVTPQMLVDFVRSLSDKLSENIDHIWFDYWVETPMSYHYSTDHYEDGVWYDIHETYETDNTFYSDDAKPFWYLLYCRFSVNDGKIVDYPGDEFIPDDQYNSGEKVIAVAKTVYRIPGQRYDGEMAAPYSLVTDHAHGTLSILFARRTVPLGTESLIFGGESYKIVGKYELYETGSWGDDTYSTVDHYEWVKIPVTAMPDSALIDVTSTPRDRENGEPSRFLFGINFKEGVTDKQYEEINQRLAEIMGENVYLEALPELMTREADYVNTVIILSIFIGILAAINMAILYRYILEKRSSELAIFRICGCTQEKAVASYLIECLIISAPLFALTQLCYHKLVLPKLIGIFKYMNEAYSFSFYAAMFSIYITVSVFIMYRMIKTAVSNHSLVTLKNAKRLTNRFGIMKVLEITQLAAIISILVIVVSAITSRYEFFKPFEQYLSRKGYLVYSSRPSITYSEEFEELIDGSDYIMSQMSDAGFGDPMSEDYVMFDGISYSDEFIEAYAPPLIAGKWLSDTDDTYESSGYIPAVITNGSGYSVGDVLSSEIIMGYDDDGNVSSVASIKYKIIGVLNDNVNLLSYIPSSWSGFSSGKLKLTNHLDMFNAFSAENEEHGWLLTRISDVTACYGSGGPVIGAQLVFCDSMTDEEYKAVGEKLSAHDNLSIAELSNIYENSKTHIYEQMYSLFPVAVCIFTLTLISAVSINAIYTKRQLRNYAIFYICGAKWSRCALMSLKNGVMTCVAASILAAVVLTFGNTFLFGETVISFGMWQLIVCTAVVVLYLILSMIMPLSIIGSAQPKEVLKEE